MPRELCFRRGPLPPKVSTRRMPAGLGGGVCRSEVWVWGRRCSFAVAPGASLRRSAREPLWARPPAGCDPGPRAPEEGAQLLPATPSPGACRGPALQRDARFSPRFSGSTSGPRVGFLGAPNAGAGSGRPLPFHQHLPRARVPDGSQFSLVQS